MKQKHYLYNSIVGDYCYVTNKNGSKQALFNKESKKVIDIINDLEILTLSNLIKELECRNETTNRVDYLYKNLETNGFFNDNKLEPRPYKINDKIMEKLKYECSKNPTPLFVNIELTTACNLKCIHCYNINNNEYIDFDKFEDLIIELKSLGTLFIGLSGGEPTLHPRFKEIIEICDKHKVLIEILTNFTTMDDTLSEYISNKSIYAIKVSLYSLDEQQHNTITKINCYNRTVDNIKKYRNQLPICISCPITKYNSDAISDLIAWTSKYKIPVNFSLSIIAKYDLSNSNIKVRTNYEQYKKCIKELKIDPYKKMFYDFDCRKLCSGGISSVAIGVNYDVYLCPIFKSLRLNHTKETIKETWENSVILTKIRNMSRKDIKKCRDCGYQDYCNVCLADNYNENGNMFIVNNETCNRKKIKFKL